VNRWTLIGVALIAAWIVIAFVIAWPSGWAHLPLAVGVIAIARAIVEGEDREGGTGKGER